jgi:hypothetical protein
MQRFCKCGVVLLNLPCQITKWSQFKDSKWSRHKIETFRGARFFFGPLNGTSDSHWLKTALDTVQGSKGRVTFVLRSSQVFTNRALFLSSTGHVRPLHVKRGAHWRRMLIVVSRHNSYAWTPLGQY